MEYIKEYDSLDMAKVLHIIRYNEENPGIVGYYILFDRYMWESDSTSKAGYREIFHTMYEKQYPDHPFTVRMLDLIASEDIRPGGRYIDFRTYAIGGNQRQNRRDRPVGVMVRPVPAAQQGADPCLQ